MGGGKTQSMIVAGILARFPHLASLVSFREPLPKAHPYVVAAFTGRATDKKVWVSLGEALGVNFPVDRVPSGRGVAGRSQRTSGFDPAGRTGFLSYPCIQSGKQG
jgi:hypothetical protein